MSQADDLQARADVFVLGLPSTMVAQHLGGQLLAAATSTAANYRAARRGRSYAEFTAKIGTVSEEADESVFWLNRVKNGRVVGTVSIEPLLAEAEELARIFTTAARTARQRRGRAGAER